MGIYYTANFGVGYQVTENDDISEGELEDGLIGYIDKELGDGFAYFEVGDSGSSGKEDDTYIVIKCAFKDGLDLTSKKKSLDDELKRLRLNAVGDFGDVGGLHSG